MNGQRPRRALVIEDDAIVRSVLQEIMTSFGYGADVAASGPEGISLFDKGRYDVVLTDLVMRAMTGWEVLAAVRALDPHVPVIIVTGSAVYPDDPRFAQPGVALVKKPVNAEVLAETLRRVSAPA